ncbi:hypothetical protein PS1_005998 [Malus domestica]
MVFALLLFLLGTRTYRYSSKGDEESPFVRIGKVFVAALRNWQTTPLAVTSEEESRGTLPHESSEQFKFLNKALLAPDDLKENRRVCTIVDVEEAKAVLRLFPIWVTCLAYAVVFAQNSTFFTKQGATMDRTIVSGFDIPAASLQTFISITTSSSSFPFMIAFLFQLLELTPGNPLELQCCKELERGCSYLLFPW